MLVRSLGKLARQQSALSLSRCTGMSLALRLWAENGKVDEAQPARAHP